MRFTIISCIIFLSLSIPISALQNTRILITGNVVNEETGAPLKDVNVFLANTTVGTTTGKNGEFSLKNVPFGTYDIIFSFVGFETEMRNFSKYNPGAFNFTISLKPKMINLNQISVTGTVPEDWKDNLEIFTRIFIGETKNSEKTKILNPEVINFIKDEKTNTFKANSDSLICIENLALGYTLYIVLEWLEYNTKDGSIKFMFYPRFKELTPVSEDEKEEWEINRRRTYLNSSKYFLYALVHNLWGKDYKIKDEDGDIFPEDLEIKSNSDSSIYELYYEGNIGIRRHFGSPSYLNFIYPSVSIDKFGNLCSPYENVIIGGAWAAQRIADLLPQDYVYKEK
jgi:hypothetical protein